MKETGLQVDIARRWWLAASAGGAAAGLAGWSPASVAQAKPLPPVATFKDASRVIVHSASGIETQRSAFGSSGVTDVDILFLRNNIAAPDAAIVGNPDAWQVQIDGVTSRAPCPSPTSSGWG